MSPKQIRYTLTDKEYNKIVKASLQEAKVSGKILSIHQYSKKVTLQATKTK